MLWTPPPLHDGEKKRNTLSHRMSLYEAARKPVRKNEGTPYPCEQRDLDGYLKHERDNSKARYITAIQATNELCDWLDHYKEPDASSLAALERLRDGIRLDPWGPDLVIKAFKDLDLAFFKGTLLGNVRVKWMCRTEWLKTIDPRCDSPMEVVGYTQPGPHAQCAIALNAHHHLLNAHRTPNPFREMWRTLLHEMCVSRKTFYSSLEYFKDFSDPSQI